MEELDESRLWKGLEEVREQSTMFNGEENNEATVGNGNK